MLRHEKGEHHLSGLQWRKDIHQDRRKQVMVFATCEPYVIVSITLDLINDDHDSGYLPKKIKIWQRKHFLLHRVAGNKEMTFSSAKKTQNGGTSHGKSEA